ncbi:Cof-type HAD-IIB family hydrolase [Ureaplasma ceti]|uniref:5-amino-6-(5-phospho-D-ribitylamino)uracil phosphatase YitU n=1 Tax=Ureaplasma ceti TaxID=3119530 RepID=A0ABP9U6X7_9BACT
MPNINNDKQYLIMSDLDGTLLNSKSQISDESVRCIKEVIKEGHIFCIATGRPTKGALPIYEKLGLDTVMVNYNGSCIVNPSDPKFSAINLTFHKDIAKKILTTPKILEVISNAFLETQDQEIIFKKYEDNEISEEVRKDIYEFYHIDPLDRNNPCLNSDVNKLDSDVNALLLYVDTNDINKFDKLMYWVKNVSPYLQLRMIMLPSQGFMVEVNTNFADKSMGLNFLSSYYGIPKDRIIAFGDSDNDMRMLVEAKFGFAMKNGKETAKMSARHITKHTNNDDGVAWELEFFMKHKNFLN